MPLQLSPADIPAQLLDRLDADQRDAVSALNGPVLVVAGPGSGKTRVLTHRVAAVHAAGVQPWRICAVTFTNKAATEMKERIAALSGDDAASQMVVSTFHSLCARILRRWHAEAGLPAGFTIADTSDTTRMMRNAAHALGLVDNMTTAQITEFCNAAARKISAAKNEGHRSHHSAGLDAATSQLWSGHAMRMKESGCVDFDDLLTYTLALKSSPEARHWLATKFDRVMVDEFQDTNGVQQQIVSLLAPTGEIFAVGDPDQSIYAFRGATGAVADMFARAYPAHKVVVLGSNYRSTATICAISAAVIAGNPAQHRSPMRPTGDGGQKAQLMIAADEEDEADVVASQVALPSGSRAILVRANQQTRPFERALAATRISHSVVGTVRFSDRAEVKDVLAWVRLTSNPHDVEGFRRAVSTPRRGVGEVTVNKVVAFAAENQCGLVDACRTLATGMPAKTAQGLSEFVSAMDECRRASRSGSATAVVKAILDAGGVRAAVAAGPADRRDERLGNVDEVAVAARHVDALIAARPAGGYVDPAAALCEHLALVSSSENADGSPSGDVVISTIHAAKGKEFDRVWVVGMEEGIMPHARSQPEDTAEERRLLFVAVSRARTTLTLTRAQSRWSPATGRSENAPTRFLSEIPGYLLAVTRSDKASDEGRKAPVPLSPPKPRPAAAKLVFTAGQKVKHSSFGPATVVSCAGGMVTAAFDRDGKQRVFVADGVHLRPA